MVCNPEVQYLPYDRATSLSSATMEVKLTKICRTCLGENNEMHSLFDVNLSCDNVANSHIIAATTGVQVSECDGLPPLICTPCKHSATLAYQFKQQSRKADVTLRSLISQKNAITEAESGNNIKSEIGTPIKYEPSHDYHDFDAGDFDIDSSANLFVEIDAKKETKNEDGSLFLCTLCNASFESDIVLRSHLLTCLKDEGEEVKLSYCLMCGASFNDAQALRHHVLLTHDKHKKRGRPAKTSNSPKKTSSKIVKTRVKSSVKINPDYDLLVPIVDGESKLPEKNILQKTCCGICNIVLDSQAELNTHFGAHSVNGVMCCALCEKIFLESEHFKRHFLTDHICADIKTQNGDMLIEGIQEGMPAAEVETSGDLSQHIRMTSLEDLLKTHSTLDESTFVQVCTGCGQLYFSSDQLIQHIDIEHQHLSTRCNFCLKTFSTTKSAARHRKVCKHADRKHACYTCGLKFAYELTLNKHILREHKGQSVSVNFMDPKYNQEKKYSCKTCAKTFFRQDLLDKHLKNHMSNDGKRYECDFCKKKFNRKDNLRSHMQIHDPQRARAASNCLCLYCGRSFSNSSNLIVHMRRHTGEKPYKCDFCGKGFPRSSDLQCHRRSHTGEKPYLCNICGKGFRRNNKLSRHMRVHTGQRPYKCTYCEKAFSQSNDLTLHIRRHTGDKPYVCRVCGDRFIQGTALHNHRRAHNHYPPSTSDIEPASLLLVQPKPIHGALTTITVKKIIDIAKL